MSNHEHVEVTIGGIKLRFPNKPYPSQISMMDKIIKGLQRKQNCLLESPTGSGKTLSLLCAAIAWQQAERISVATSLQNDMQQRVNKLRESCFCDCSAREKLKQFKKEENAHKLHLQDRPSSTAAAVAAAADVVVNNQSPSSSDDLNFGDEKENENGDKKLEDATKETEVATKEENNEEKTEDVNEEKEEVKCPCICHGMYNDALFQQEEEKKVSFSVPKIYYTTRTHKQIANVIKEFKKTVYSKTTKMTILAGRQHLCIHPQVSKMPNRDEVCKKLNKEKFIEADELSNEQKLENGCTYFNRFKKNPISYDNYGFKSSVWDIEELIHSFKRKRLCPYYGARELMNEVDIIFCPYNYLIDPRIRSSMNINLKNEILIIDEAHNLEDSCRESTTFFITRTNIELARQEIITAINYMSEGTVKEAAIFFHRMCDQLVHWIERGTSPATMQQRDFDASMSKIWGGLEMVAEFKMMGIGPEKFAEYGSHMGILFGEKDDKTTAIELTDVVKILIETIHLILHLLYTDQHGFMDDFKVAITRSKTTVVEADDEFALSTQTRFRKSSVPANPWTYTINFWCLNPAVAFHYLKSCHSVILCSGTLTPMDTFQSELGVKFEHQLEANHVITDKQVWVGCLGYGPTDVNLLATYKSCETLAFQDEVGRLVIDVCKQIPFGVLFFVPSYSLLNKLMSRWDENGLMRELKEYKQVFSETRVAKNFDQLLKDYYDCIDKSVDAEKHNGAFMIAVYRGRASEGLDFSDNYARAVIALGIPYPNVKDIQVDLKRQYNNLYSFKKNLLKGDQWYEIQAYRAVNQALGRCIRHRNDWGAIILVDDRYFKQPEKYSKGLSKWIRNRFHTYRNYSDALKSLKEFSNQLREFTKEQKIAADAKLEEERAANSQKQPPLPDVKELAAASATTAFKNRKHLAIQYEDDNDENDYVSASSTKYPYSRSGSSNELVSMSHSQSQSQSSSQFTEQSGDSSQGNAPKFSSNFSNNRNRIKKKEEADSTAESKNVASNSKINKFFSPVSKAESVAAAVKQLTPSSSSSSTKTENTKKTSTINSLFGRNSNAHIGDVLMQHQHNQQPHSTRNNSSKKRNRYSNNNSSKNEKSSSKKSIINYLDEEQNDELNNSNYSKLNKLVVGVVNSPTNVLNQNHPYTLVEDSNDSVQLLETTKNEPAEDDEDDEDDFSKMKKENKQFKQSTSKFSRLNELNDSQ